MGQFVVYLTQEAKDDIAKHKKYGINRLKER